MNSHQILLVGIQ